MRQSVKAAAEAAKEIVCSGIEKAAAAYNKTVENLAGVKKGNNFLYG